MTDFSEYRYVDTTPKMEKAKRLLWCLVWAILFRTSPRGFLYSWRNTLLRLFGAKIGTGSRIAPSCFVWAPWNLEMGTFSVLGDGVDCYSMGKIVIGSKVAVSQRAFLCTGSHDIRYLTRPLTVKAIVINDHAWVCAEVFVGPGVTIGQGAVLAARAAVVRDVDEWTVVGGNPAKLIKKRVIEER